MGWSSIHLNMPVKDWFKKNVSEEATVLDVAIVKRNTLYAAIRENKTGFVYCAVYLLSWSKGYNNFSYKPMVEFVGPCESECPERILKLLSPLNNEIDPNGWAEEWRKRCWDNINNRKKMKLGYILKANMPISFTNGDNYQYFKKIGRILFAGIIENNQFIPVCRVRLNTKYYKFETILLE